MSLLFESEKSKSMNDDEVVASVVFRGPCFFVSVSFPLLSFVLFLFFIFNTELRIPVIFFPSSDLAWFCELRSGNNRRFAKTFPHGLGDGIDIGDGIGIGIVCDICIADVSSTFSKVPSNNQFQLPSYSDHSP